MLIGLPLHIREAANRVKQVFDMDIPDLDFVASLYPGYKDFDKAIATDLDTLTRWTAGNLRNEEP